MYSDMYINPHTFVNKHIHVSAHTYLVTARHTSKHLLKQFEGTRKDAMKGEFTFYAYVNSLHH